MLLDSVLLEWFTTDPGTRVPRCAILLGRQLRDPLLNVWDSSELQIQLVLFTMAVIVSLTFNSKK